MIYILETELLENQLVWVALTKIYGIGKHKSLNFCKSLGFSKNLKINNLTNYQINKLIKTIENSSIFITTDLKKFKYSIIKNLFDIKSYRGIRLSSGLPCRGQRTHTNAKTSKRVKNLNTI